MSSRGQRPGPPPAAVTGVQLAQGIGVPEARGLWAEAWSQVVRRPGAMLALVWLSVIGFFAVSAPFVANGNPLVQRELDASGAVIGMSSPLLRSLRASDVVLAVAGVAGGAWILLGPRRTRGQRVADTIVALVVAGIAVSLGMLGAGLLGRRDLPGWLLAIRQASGAGWGVGAVAGIVAAGVGAWVPAIEPLRRRVAVALAGAVVAGAAVGLTHDRPLEVYGYIERERAGDISALYTLVPWSHNQRFSELSRRPPLTSFGEATGRGPDPASGRTFWLGTDAFGQDVLAQVLAACRLAISIGLVSTGIALLIGVTVGSVMGYFGGWIDLVLYRVVEVFMAVPVLFLLILAAAVLPPHLRTTYTMMAIIGCFTWTGAARFTRAEFLRLRNQDFVQAARAAGLPLRAVLFRHMLPNGVTPVLVDASFTIAAAITIEATLSYLGLGPEDQASWGRLLASAINAEGQFKWWLAVFPGMMIFLTVLSYNMVGEALRDAMDPKLRKARV